MTMLITRFHRLIQNKLVWIVFSVIVVLSFVFWGTQTVDTEDYSRQFAAGELHGEPISREELNDAKFSSYLSFILSTGTPLPYTSRLEEQIRPLAWRRLASLRLAQRMGLTAGDGEVYASILQEPAFQTDGQFDAAKYEAFLNEQLGALLGGRLTKQRFERHVREELTLGKLRTMLQQTVLVPPAVSRQAYHRLRDQHNVLYAVIRRDPLAETVEVTEADARAYFESSPEEFELPERRVIAYTRVDLDAVAPDAPIQEADIESYYQRNREQFALEKPDAADVIDLTAEAGAEGDDGVGGYRPLEDVREEIVAALRREQARVQALDIANDLVYDLQPDQFGNAPAFAELTEKYDLPLAETPPFDRAQSSVDGLPDDVADEVISQAFQLYDTPDEYYSNPIAGEDAVLVIALREVLEPEIPAFEEVRDEALAAARDQAVQEALQAQAEEVRSAMQAAADTGREVSQAVRDVEAETSETGFFSVAEGLEDLPFAAALGRAVTRLNVGETSEPISAAGDLVVAHVLDRRPAEEDGFADFEDSFEQTMQLQYASAMLNDWQEQLLEQAGFVDHFASPPDEEQEPARRAGATN